jgi:hypothetical protein
MAWVWMVFLVFFDREVSINAIVKMKLQSSYFFQTKNKMETYAGNHNNL